MTRVRAARCHGLSNFYNQQRPLWDDLRKSMERFRLNQLQLERDASASAALQRMEQILKAPSPYKMLPEVRSHIDAVQAIHDSLVSAVSYTHLTLPTTLIGRLLLAAVFIKTKSSEQKTTTKIRSSLLKRGIVLPIRQIQHV